MSEILAPAGSAEALTAALNCGADAIYLGVKDFSARRNAQNFSFDELNEAVSLCHGFSVKVYVALNTLIYDKEIGKLAETIKKCAECDVDGLIIQDLAAAALTKKIVPHIPLHASTQMTVNSLYGAKLLKKLGFSRVVLGRELSYEQIKYITRNCGIETEIFVHGALCASISGQCYISSVLGCRSGNRGLCAQPCRLNFSYNDRDNILSLKDYSIISNLNLLKEAGVTSFKIEGRMKRPEYVAATVNACRSVLDGIEYDLSVLKNVFSRSGFTSGYFNSELRSMSGIRTKDDVIAASSVLPEIRQLYNKPFKRFSVDMDLKIKKNVPASLKISTNGVSVEAFGAIPQRAMTTEISAQSAKERLSKLGGTVYEPNKIITEVDNNLFLSASDLNDLRRKGTKMLTDAILKLNSNNYNINEYVHTNGNTRNIPQNIKYRCEVLNKKQLYQALKNDDYEYIYAPMEMLDEDTPDKFRIAAVTPVFLADCEEKVFNKLKKLKNSGFNHAIAHTLSHIELINNVGMIPIGSHRLNITNALSLEEYKKTGINDTTLSFELIMEDALKISENSNDIKCGVIAYGRLPLMITRRCPINDERPCGENKNPNCLHMIKDRKGRIFPCLCSQNSVEIYNPDLLFLADKEIKGFDYLLFKFTDEQDIDMIFRMYMNKTKPSEMITRGLYYRTVQ